MSWIIETPEGTPLSPDEWDQLLDLGKRFIASLETWNERGKPLKVGTILLVQSRLRYLMIWMARNGHRTFSAINPEIADDFVDDLAREKGVEATRDVELAVTRNTLSGYIDVLCRLYEQRSIMSLGAAPDSKMPVHPFGGRTALEMAGTVAALSEGWIPPVPDDVWLPTVAAAVRWIEANGAVLARLGGILAASVHDRNDAEPSPTEEELRLAVLASDGDGRLARWLGTFRGRRTNLLERNGRVPRRAVSISWLYKSAMTDLRNAACIVVQALVGMRIGELAGLKAEGVGRDGPWPACVEVHRSRTGLDEIFHVRGEVFKLRDRPEEVTWVAGSRPFGTDHVPVVVKAIEALNAAYRPWREMSGKRDLFLTLNDERGLPRHPMDIAATNARALSIGQHRFMLAHADLPQHRRAWALSSHQWRKSFAINVIRADGRLLAAVGDHFKHLSIAMTERGYLGRDPTLLGMVDDMGVREAARLLFEAATGAVVAKGRTSGAIHENARNIVHLGGGGRPETRIERIEEVLKHDDLRAWPTDYGHCLFRAETARCHRPRIPEEPIPTAPNQLRRHPGICGECANLLVGKPHVVFWKERMDENASAAVALTEVGEPAAALAANRRAEVARVHVHRTVPMFASIGEDNH